MMNNYSNKFVKFIKTSFFSSRKLIIHICLFLILMSINLVACSKQINNSYSEEGDNITPTISVTVGSTYHSESTQTPTHTVTPQGIITPDNTYGFYDTFDDNQKDWFQTWYILVSDGVLGINSPDGTPWSTTCENCRVTNENNYFQVDITWNGDNYSRSGIVLDWQGCNFDLLSFFLYETGKRYQVAQSVFNEEYSFQNWRYYFPENTTSQSIQTFMDTVNTVGAEYEFLGDSLFITLYVNQSYVNRFEVFDYNGSNYCIVGVVSDGSAVFDNFYIGSREDAPNN